MDQSGPEMAKLLLEMSEDPSWPLSIEIKKTALVPDNIGDKKINSFLSFLFSVFISFFLSF